jgi:hypothetical protein
MASIAKLKGWGGDTPVIAGLTGRSSIPEAAVMESRSHGVLGRPVKPGDDN